MFKVGGYAIPIGTKKIKIVEEIELVGGEYILYMTDGSSYHLNQLMDIHETARKEGIVV